MPEDPDTVPVNEENLEAWCRTSRGMNWEDDVGVCKMARSNDIVEIDRRDTGEDKIRLGRTEGIDGTIHTTAPLRNAVINEHGTLVVDEASSNVLGGGTPEFYKKFGFDPE